MTFILSNRITLFIVKSAACMATALTINYANFNPLNAFVCPLRCLHYYNRYLFVLEVQLPITQDATLCHIPVSYVGHKVRHFIGISPYRDSNPCDKDICHTARRSNHSAIEQGQHYYATLTLIPKCFEQCR